MNQVHTGCPGVWAALPPQWRRQPCSTARNWPNGPAGRPGKDGSGARVTHPALIASDVDGTLIDSAEILSARTRAVITAAVESGSAFVLATGRPPRWITPIVDALGFAPISVCANGSVLYDAENDRIISAATLSPSELAVLAEVAQAAIPGWAWPWNGWGAVHTMPPRRSSSARRVMSMHG